MLEEALNSDNYPPSETATALLSFLKHELPVGSAAEVRFCHLFPSICTRVFGPLDVTIGNTKKGDESNEAGWISRRTGCHAYRNATSASVSRSSSPVSLARQSCTYETDPVVRLLSARAVESGSQHWPTLIEAISAESVHRPGVRFAYPIHALPRPTRDILFRLLSPATSEETVGSTPVVMRDNCVRLAHLGGILQKSYPRQLPPTANRTENPTKIIMLTMLELYLFCFTRFPLDKSSKQNKQTKPTVQDHLTNKSHYGDNVYVYLFKNYLLGFLPRKKECGTVPRDTELFLRIVIEFWLDGENTPLTTAAAIARQNLTIHPFDVTRLSSPYQPTPQLVQTCLRALVVNLITDPALLVQVRQTSLTAPLTMIQQSLFNYIRVTLRYAPVHYMDSPFFSALNLWLILLEPWNVVPRKKDIYSTQNAKNILLSHLQNTKHNSTPTILSLSIPHPTAKSKFTSDWSPYIALHYHFYLTPLAIFLRRAREFDFFDKKSINTVRRVFRVYSPRVVGELGEDSTLYLKRQHQQVMGEYCPPNTSLSDLRSDTAVLLEEIYVRSLKKIHDLDFVERLGERIEGYFGRGGFADLDHFKSFVGQVANVVGLSLQECDAILSGVGNTTGVDQRRVSLERDGGCLTQKGRRQILAGAGKCDPREIHFLGDPMYAGVKTYEISFLVRWCNLASVYLNDKLRLGDFTTLHADTLEDEDDLLELKMKERERMRNVWFRINLRFLADFRNILFFCLLAIFWRCFRG